MHPELNQISAHMRDFGCAILGRAVYDATFNEMTKPYSHSISVTFAAQATEILIKARIAQEHPLLIFENLPQPAPDGKPLGMNEIYENGRTVSYADLPDLLWASTGYRMKNKKQFLDFGKLRNKIIHLAPPRSLELGEATFRFVFLVVEPMLEAFWGDSLLNYVEEWDDAIISDGYLMEQVDEFRLPLTKTAKEIVNQNQTP